MELFKVIGVPDKGLDKTAILDMLGNVPFALKYDLRQKSTYLCLEVDSTDKITRMSRSMPGLQFEHESTNSSNPTGHQDAFVEVCIYRDEEAIDEKLLSDVFDLGLDDGEIYITFNPKSGSSVEKQKRQLEKTLGSMEVSRTASIQRASLSSKMNISIHRDNFNESENTELLTRILDSLNESILRSDRVYSIRIFIGDNGILKDYISSKFLILSTSYARRFQAQDMLSFRDDKRDLLFGIMHASKFINFYGRIKTAYSLHTPLPLYNGDTLIGTFVKDGVLETTEKVYLNSLTLNLGILITGLPGSGKSINAMHILEGTKQAVQTVNIAAISPTEEWNEFAANNGTYLVKLYDNNTPINFFRCPEGSDTVKFYEDLAMILASSSDAGPYQKPLEKCLLNAFSRVYNDTAAPNPALVYKEIEESVIRFHAKRSNTGTKYTKHGENIKSALENLRRIISRAEYSGENGIKVEDLLGKGIVFDMSQVSNSSKPYIYALVLNQLYSIMSQYDAKGDGELRVVVCLEEAHLVFKDRDSAAVMDLQSRIQDFRKRGIGLMLLTQNPINIEPSIRRLCQTKMYFKQSPDIAGLAAKDLLFSNTRDDMIESKLKRLGSRVCAFSGIARDGPERAPNDTIFVKTTMHQTRSTIYENPIDDYIRTKELEVSHVMDMKLMIEKQELAEHKQPQPSAFRLIYFGEEVGRYQIAENGNTVQACGKSIYNVQILDKKGHILKEIDVISSPEVTIRI